jgi:hypothetical protein
MPSPRRDQVQLTRTEKATTIVMRITHPIPRRKKSLLYLSPNLKKSATVVESQATDHLIVEIRTRFLKKSGPLTRLQKKSVTSKPLRTPTMLQQQPAMNRI